MFNLFDDVPLFSQPATCPEMIVPLLRPVSFRYYCIVTDKLKTRSKKIVYSVSEFVS